MPGFAGLIVTPKARNDVEDEISTGVSMKQYVILPIAIIAMQLLEGTSLAETDNIGALPGFTGKCTKFEGKSEIKDYCEDTVHDFCFVDGYDLFQFRTPAKSNDDQDRGVIAFVKHRIPFWFGCHENLVRIRG